jgi:hypothetical protein
MTAWGRCLKVTLHACIPKNVHLCGWEYDQTHQTFIAGPTMVRAEILNVFNDLVITLPTLFVYLNAFHLFHGNYTTLQFSHNGINNSH